MGISLIGDTAEPIPEDHLVGSSEENVACCHVDMLQCRSTYAKHYPGHAAPGTWYTVQSEQSEM